MTRMTDHAPDFEISDEPSVRPPRRILWLVAVIVAMAIAGVAGVTITEYLTRPAATIATVSNGDDPTDSPAAATKAYVEAMKDNDLARAHRVLCAKHHANPFDSGGQDPMLGTYRHLQEASNDGATATVTVTLTFEPGAVDAGDRHVKFTVVKELERWRVCDVEQVQ